ncbi:hypothetical protein PVAP13_3NG051190 [Panicum virgatum]|uniref:Uncharacterized protein n=1 Tax=Panicum virgatum TaxID=38727 RepID=A0A8T0U3G7_PANVG|nr:hypothetical protein PVAP13_3NG051190 [Panicum virgatum]
MSPPSRPTPATTPTATTRFAPLTTSLPSGSLPRSRPCGPAPPWAPQRSHEGLKEEPPPRRELLSSLGSFSHWGTLGGRSGRVSKDHTAQEAKLHPEEELESFFGQLWAVPSSPRRHPPRVSPEGLLFWVRKDLVRERRITIQECFPVRKSDRLDSKPLQLSFSRDIWGGPICKDTYADVVKKRKMAEERDRWVWQPDPPQRPVRQLRQDPPGRPQQQHQTHPPPQTVRKLKLTVRGYIQGLHHHLLHQVGSIRYPSNLGPLKGSKGNPRRFNNRGECCGCSSHDRC